MEDQMTKMRQRHAENPEANCSLPSTTPTNKGAKVNMAGAQEKNIGFQRQGNGDERQRVRKQICSPILRAPESQRIGPTAEVPCASSNQYKKKDSVKYSNYEELPIPKLVPVSSFIPMVNCNSAKKPSVNLDTTKVLPTNKNEQSSITTPKHPDNFAGKTRERFENLRTAAVERFVSVIDSVTNGEQLFMGNGLEDLLNAYAQEETNSFQHEYCDVPGVNREVEKLKNQLNLKKEGYRRLNTQKVADRKAEMTERVKALRGFYQKHLCELLNKNTVTDEQMDLRISNGRIKICDCFRDEYQTPPGLVETQLKLLERELENVNKAFKVQVEEHNLGIEMEKVKAKVQFNYKQLTNAKNIKDLEDLKAAHLEAVKKIEEVCQAKKHIYKFAGMPAFIEDMKKAKIAELENKQHVIITKLLRMHDTALGKYVELMQKGLGMGIPVEKPVVASLHKESQKLVTEEFEDSFTEIQNDIKNAPQRLARCLGSLDARLGEMFMEFEVKNKNLWIRYEEKVARVLKESKQFFAVEMKKVGKPDGYSTAEDVLAAAEMKFDNAANVRLFEPRYVTDARKDLLNFKISENADDDLADQTEETEDTQVMIPTGEGEPELLQVDPAKVTSVPEADPEAVTMLNNEAKEVQVVAEQLSTPEIVCAGTSKIWIEELDNENSSRKSSSQESFEVIQHFVESEAQNDAVVEPENISAP